MVGGSNLSDVIQLETDGSHVVTFVRMAGTEARSVKPTQSHSNLYIIDKGANSYKFVRPHLYEFI